MTPLTHNCEHPNITTQEQLNELKRSLTKDLRRLNYYSKLKMLDYEDGMFHKHTGQDYCIPRDVYINLETLKQLLLDTGFLNIIICTKEELYQRLK